jgi:amino acid permease
MRNAPASLQLPIILIYGVIVMSLLAAFIEAFWSSNATIDPNIKYAVGGFLWLSVITYLVLVGRNRAI